MKPNGKIVIEKPWGGWVNNPSSLSNSRGMLLDRGDQYSKSSQITLLQGGFQGCIAPGFPVANVVTDNGQDGSLYVNSTPIAGCASGTAATGTLTDLFAVLANGRLVAWDSNLTGVLASFTPTSGSAKASSQNNDCIGITSPTGVNQVLWSWEGATSNYSDISLVSADGTGADYDYFSTRTPTSGTLSLGVPLKMWQGPDAKIYCTNGQNIASLDLVNNTSNNKALDVNSGYVTTSGCAYGLYSAIVGYKKTSDSGSYNKGEARLWLWRGYSSSFDQEFIIPDSYVGKIENDNNVLYVWTYGRNATVKYMRFNGSSFDVLFESPEIGLAPNHSSGDMYLNQHFWAESGGRVLSYGGINGKQGLSHVSIFTNDGTAYAPMLKNLSSNNCYIGANNGTAHTIQRLTIGNYATNASFRTGVYSLPTNSTITAIKLYFAQFGSGASIQVSLFRDFNNVSIGGATDLLNKTITNANEGAITYYPIETTIDNVNAFYMVFTFNHANTTDVAAILRKVEIEYLSDYNI